MELMMNRHLSINEVEEHEFLKRNHQDLDMEIINEHYTTKKGILEKTMYNYIDLKRKIDMRESAFLENLVEKIMGVLEFYMTITWKLRKTYLEEKDKESQLLTQNNDFINALVAIKNSNPIKVNMNVIKKTINVRNEELAHR